MKSFFTVRHAILHLFWLGFIFACLSPIQAADFATFSPNPDKANGKKIVLISGDEEYRSEESLPQLGRILAVRHGFETRVLFAVNPEDGKVDPTFTENIPGLAELRDADLMIIAARFRNLPDAQMKEIDDYLRRGGNVIGLRTATHAFHLPPEAAYARYDFRYAGEEYPDWQDGFGRKILGETWIDHHGNHGQEAQRGIIIPEKKDHPFLKGVADIFGPTDVYKVRLPLPDDCEPLVLGEVVEGMNPENPPVKGEKNDPKMPIVWLKTWSVDGGPVGKSLTTTMGASVDLKSEGFRRLLVNACYGLTGLEIPEKANVNFVGDYQPSFFGFGQFKTGLKPEDF